VIIFGMEAFCLIMGVLLLLAVVRVTVNDYDRSNEMGSLQAQVDLLRQRVYRLEQPKPEAEASLPEEWWLRGDDPPQWD
jgi:hypothetical protein